MGYRPGSSVAAKAKQAQAAARVCASERRFLEKRLRSSANASLHARGRTVTGQAPAGRRRANAAASGGRAPRRPYATFRDRKGSLRRRQETWPAVDSRHARSGIDGAARRPPRAAYFFSSSPPSGAPCAGAVAPPGVTGLNGKLLNMFFAWFCICSCICTNMFFDCSM